MNLSKITLLSSIFLITACGEAGKAGAECSTDADCADGLECHMHEGEADHGECEAADDDHAEEEGGEEAAE